MRGIAIVALITGFLFAAAFRNGLWTSEPDIWKDAVKKSANRTRTHSGLADTYERANRLADAEREYEAALALSPDNADAAYNLGVVCWKSGQEEKAVASFDRALALKPDFADAAYNLGVVHLAQKKMPQAEQELLRALRLNPRMTEAYNNLGLLYYRQARFEKAEQEFRRALEIKPDDTDAAMNLELAREQQRKRKQL
jgi:tetratricopeptide (TPR) repeat protein